MLRKTKQLLDKPVPNSPMKKPSHALVRGKKREKKEMCEQFAGGGVIVGGLHRRSVAV